MTDMPKIGDRGTIVGRHPWAGSKGEVVRVETIRIMPSKGPLPVVRLERDDAMDGHEAFIFSASEWQAESTKKGRKIK
jgi:hypothetical protein